MGAPPDGAGSSPEPIHQAEGLTLGDLSQFFNPFLTRFVRDSLSTGGEVWVTRTGPRVDGLLLFHEVERTGSIFTRDRARAEQLRGLRGPVAVFAELPLTPAVEVYSVWERRTTGPVPAHRFRHPVRTAGPADLPAVGRVLREAYGRFDSRWLDLATQFQNRCFLVEVAGEVAGVGCVSVVGDVGRLYSLTVRPRYRRLGVGTDLWHARWTWAVRAGAGRVLSEISELNVPSIAIAEHAGMRRLGPLYLSRVPPQVRGAPQLGQTLSVTSIRFPQ